MGVCETGAIEKIVFRFVYLRQAQVICCSKHHSRQYYPEVNAPRKYCCGMCRYRVVLPQE